MLMITFKAEVINTKITETLFNLFNVVFPPFWLKFHLAMINCKTPEIPWKNHVIFEFCSLCSRKLVPERWVQLLWVEQESKSKNFGHFLDQSSASTRWHSWWIKWNQTVLETLSFWLCMHSHPILHHHPKMILINLEFFSVNFLLTCTFWMIFGLSSSWSWSSRSFRFRWRSSASLMMLTSVGLNHKM